MADESEDGLIVERLQTLGVTHTTEWEVLAFLYRHAASLATAAQIAHLVGCDRLTSESPCTVWKAWGSSGVRASLKAYVFTSSQCLRKQPVTPAYWN